MDMAKVIALRKEKPLNRDCPG